MSFEEILLSEGFEKKVFDVGRGVKVILFVRVISWEEKGEECVCDDCDFYPFSEYDECYWDSEVVEDYWD